MEEITKASENALTLEVVARIRNDFPTKFGLPRQSGLSSSLISKIVFEPQYRNPDLLRGIEGYSHLWLIWGFSEVFGEKWSPTVRPPRLGGNKRVGVFASRSPFRPNNLGLSVVKLEQIKKTADRGTVLIVSGADLIDNTPIYDIKPYIPYADSIPDALGGYAEENKGHKLEVIFPEELKAKIPERKIKILTECLADDPRPSYQDDGRDYTMLFNKFDISFSVSGGILTITDVKEVQ
jgi:tRNA-Thr(GGU) m(6)t(6)A37 methyltransferase TsaA